MSDAVTFPWAQSLMGRWHKRLPDAADEQYGGGVWVFTACGKRLWATTLSSLRPETLSAGESACHICIPGGAA